MIKKVIQLQDDEEIYITNSNNKILKIKNSNGMYKTSEITDLNLKVNTEITNISFEELKRFCLFEDYYQNTIGGGISKELEKNINKIMDHHMNIIYGKGNSEKEIVDTEYQCIIYYE